MDIPFYQVDAFAGRCLAGNPAAVMLPEGPLEDNVLQAIAEENNLSETAFLMRKSGGWSIRWFTPRQEVSLCGHATLASAAVILERIDPSLSEVVFDSASGPLKVRREGKSFAMDFPAWRPAHADEIEGIANILGCRVLETASFKELGLVRVESAQAVRDVSPDIEGIRGLALDGLIVTAEGDGGYDFTSRFFAPAIGIDEDPATGAAHCMLAPFWAERLGRSTFTARQASRRGADIRCKLTGVRVELQGECSFYLEGIVTI